MGEDESEDVLSAVQVAAVSHDPFPIRAVISGAVHPVISTFYLLRPCIDSACEAPLLPPIGPLVPIFAL